MDADIDEDAAKVIEGTGGDPDKIRSNMRLKLQDRDLYTTKEGVETPPKVAFREIDPFDCWVWAEFHAVPSTRDKELLDSCVKAWFMVGKLGGYNSGNLQTYRNADDDHSFFEYSNNELEDDVGAFLHEATEVEYKGSWGRFRIDMGTADELCLDVLINMMAGFSRDLSGLKKIYMGGSNRNWPAPKKQEEADDDGMDDLERQGMGSQRFSVDPMRLPDRMEEELDLLEEEMQEQDRTMEKQRDLLSGKRGAGGRGGEDEGGRGREMNLAASAMASSSPFSFSSSTPSSSSSPSPSGASKSGASSSSRGGGDSPGVKKNKAPAPGTKEAAMVAMIAEKLAARKARSSNLSSPASLKGTSPGGSTWGAGIGRAATAARKSKAGPSPPSTSSSSP